MRQISIVLAMVAALLVAFFALSARAEPPLTILRAENTYDVHPDGTYTETYHAELRPANDAAARREAQQAFAYSPTQEDFEILEAYTRKADGRVVRADGPAVRDQLATGSSDRTLLTDQREKVVVFPDVVGGDTLVYTFRRTLKHAILPGQFMTAIYLARDVPLLDYTLTIRAPRTLVLRTETHDLEYSETAQGDAIVRCWHTSIAHAETSAVAVGPFDRLPRVFASTEPDWSAFARDYAALTQPHARVTPRIRVLADSVAGNAASRREAARLLYEWVNTHIRYVALYLDDGALEPHDAETVLANGWGDCKDHEVLLQALLAARGIDSEMVLINLGSHYTLSGPPTFAQLDHAITYIPELNLYVDSTASMAAFGVLPFSEYGKPVVHVGSKGEVLRRIPPLPPGVAEAMLRTTATLHEDGSITGTSATTASGPFATELKRDAAWVDATGDGAAAMQLRAIGEQGSGDFSYDPPVASSSTYVLGGSFALEAMPELVDDDDSFVPPTGLRLLAQPGEGLLAPHGPHMLGADQPAPCFAGRQVEEIALTLPPGRHLARVPADLQLEGDWGSYSSHWAVQGSTVTRRAELISRLTDSLCTGERRQAVAAALQRIRRDLRTQIALAPADTRPSDSKPLALVSGGVTQASAPGDFMRVAR
jgi:hypothetical protein